MLQATEEKLQALLEKVCEDVTTRARVTDNFDGGLGGEGGEDEQGGKARSGGGEKSKSMFAMKQEELERRRNLKKAEEEADLLGDFIRLADYILARLPLPPKSSD